MRFQPKDKSLIDIEKEWPAKTALSNSKHIFLSVDMRKL